MQEDGFIDRAWKEVLEYVGDHKCQPTITSTETKIPEPLTLKEMGGIFAMHVILTLLSLLYALWRHFYVKGRKLEDMKAMVQHRHRESKHHILLELENRRSFDDLGFVHEENSDDREGSADQETPARSVHPPLSSIRKRPVPSLFVNYNREKRKSSSSELPGVYTDESVAIDHS